MKPANLFGQAFSRDLAMSNHQQISEKESSPDDEAEIHVQTAGASLTELYESIRNASQYNEGSLQLTHAILRFIEPYFWSDAASKIDNYGNYLVNELTTSGYLANDSIKQSLANKITSEIKQHLSLKNNLVKTHSKQQITAWIIAPLSVRIEHMLNDHSKDQPLINLAFNYFLGAIDSDRILDGAKADTYQSTLYMAIQKALLGSEEAAIRLNIMERYNVQLSRYSEYARFNNQVDEALHSDLFDKLTRLVDRQGAVFRTIQTASHNDKDFSKHVLYEKSFLGPFEAAIQHQYVTARKQVLRGIWRSIAFLILTKFIIGIAIEVPYDLMVNDQVMWRPLIINLLLPPIYMIMLQLTLTMPDKRNTKALHREASRILFHKPPEKPFLYPKKRNFSKTYNFIYAMLFLTVFAVTSWILIKYARFEAIHLIIFFIFISTASFLGFRLSRNIRRIEVGDEAQTTASILRDFIYMPFVAVGQKINETYVKINFVSRILDMFVELPLKTIVGFMRRWGSYMSARRDDL